MSRPIVLIAVVAGVAGGTFGGSANAEAHHAHHARRHVHRHARKADSEWVVIGECTEAGCVPTGEREVALQSESPRATCILYPTTPSASLARAG